MPMSKQFEDREAELQKEKADAENKKNIKATMIYWAPASEFQIGNYVQEKWEGNRLIQPEDSLRFRENILATSDPKEIAFIEASNSFKAGVIKKCESMAVAAVMTAQHVAFKAGISKIENKIDESVVITEKG